MKNHPRIQRIALGILTTLAAAAPLRADKVLINEIMYHPGYGSAGNPGYVAEDTRKEYIEFYNPGTNAISLSGWRIQKAVSFAFPDVSIAPNGYVVVAADSDVNRFKASYSATYPAVAGATVVGGWTGILGNNGDNIELVDNLGKQIDLVTYTTEGDWARRRTGDPYPGSPSWWTGWKWENGADAGGKSIELINAARPNKYGQNWADSLNDGGTPGGPNSVASTSTAPFIVEVKHSPAVPKSNESVTVTARIVEELNLTSTVSLFYRLDGASGFTTVPMVDDGQHGDGLANDGVFGVFLPAQPDQSIVEFYVRVSNDAGRVRTWPGPSDDQGTQAANALYQVDNSAYLGNQPVYRLITPSAEWTAWLDLMDHVSGGQYSDATMNATFISVDGVSTEIRYCSGLRNRGAGTRAAHPHNMHVAIPYDHLWRNQSALALNTRTVHSQVAANALNAIAGLPTEYGAPVQVRVNGRNLANLTPTGGTDSYQFGSYFCFQPYGDEWLTGHYPTDTKGNLYKGVWNFDNHSLSHQANLSYLGEDPAAYREVYSSTGPTSDTGPYIKRNNVSADDWSDLINLCRVLNQAPDSSYIDQVSQIVNIDEWLNYFAVTMLVGNRETTLGTGTGDDYSMYRPGVDQRFQLLPHDMDTTLGQGDAAANPDISIFQACNAPAINRFLKHPAITPRYYATLKRLAETAFSLPQANPVLDQVLGGWVSDDIINNMKEFVVSRRTDILLQIPSSLSITSNLPLVNGYYKSTSSTASLNGQADGIRARSVRVNGAPATWTQWSATWAANNVALNPGVNVIRIESLDSNGVAFATSTINVWYDTGTGKTVTGGTLTGDTAWTANAGPYTITRDLTVGSGATLSIEPGTAVYLGSGVNLTVANGGRILAEGSEGKTIAFLSPPATSTSWGGLTINGSVGSPETHLAYVFFQGNGQTCIEVAGGTLHLDHATFGTTTHQYVALDGSSFILQHCYFPTSTASFELLHGTGGIKSGGHGIVRDCFFGSTTGYNDIMDFTGGNRPNQPIIQYYNNVFAGASDDILDLDGTDAWIEGNIFLHTHKNGSPDTASAISGGNDSGNTSEITIIGNIIYDCDHAAMAKQGNFYTLINNTIVHQTHQGGLDTDGAVICVADDGTTQAAGMYLEGNIIYDIEKLVRNQTNAVVTFTNNLMSLPWTGRGGGNSIADPQFNYMPQLAETSFTNWDQAQILRQWFGLRPASAAIGTGPNGADKGGIIPLGVNVTGQPIGTTYHDSAILTVGPLASDFGVPIAGFPYGSGFTHYQWKLDDGVFSAETPTTTPITLTGLANGPHTVSVIGKNDALEYQNDPALGLDADVTQSRSWTVDTSLPGHIRLNEVLAYNRGSFANNGLYPDAVELYNDGGQPVNLAGMMLISGITNQGQFVFPAGTTLGAEQYLVLFADKLTNAVGLHLGFGLNRSGDNLQLVEPNGTVADSVVFGPQLADFSIGRLADGGWALTKPTLGAINVPAMLGDPSKLKINEWLTDARNAAPADFIELYNPNSAPVNLGGLVLSDQSVGQPGLPALTPLSFIAPKGFALFYADKHPEAGAIHLDFSLYTGPGAIGLFAPDLTPIDVVYYGPQSTDVSQGRSPNGASTLAFYQRPTPGFVNPGSDITTNIVSQSIPLIANINVWKYDQTGIPSADWITPEYTGDSGWPAGAALLYVEGDAKPWPKSTPLTLGRTTYYFRSHFNVGTNLAGAVLNLRTIIDDGAVFYFNGTEALRLHMNPGTVTYDTFAQDHESALEGPFALSANLLHEGDNVVAVEVHQVNANSSDIVFGLSLDATFSVTNTVTNTLPTRVVLNEIMAHNTSFTNLDGSVSDWIELFNPATESFDLADLSLTDDPTLPRKWVFPPNSTIAANGYAIVQMNDNTNASDWNTGFALKAEGGSVYLFDTLNRDGALVDDVTYGLQAADLSIGRFGTNGWTLTQPTPGTPNTPISLGNTQTLKINEWMANPASGNDWFELYNPDPQPVALSGLLFTDDLAKTNGPAIPALSFIGSGLNGYQKFVADSSPTKGANHVAFKLSSAGETINLLNENLVLIDQVGFGTQSAGVSQGRYPDGATNIVLFPNSSTPGRPNTLTNTGTDSDGDGLPDDWELAHGLNPNDPADAALDSDGDGLTNLEEYLAGTDPRDPASSLAVSIEERPGMILAIRFLAQAGKSYAVQYRDNLSSGAWLNLQNVASSPAAVVAEVNDAISVDHGGRFYRVVCPAPGSP